MSIGDRLGEEMMAEDSSFKPKVVAWRGDPPAGRSLSPTA
jgi:hypothetical protein